MKYKINALIYYDATDGAISLEKESVDTHLSITANALLFYFIQHPGVVNRDEVLKRVWDDNGLVSSNSNLNQYLSLLRKTFRHYGIENIIVTIAKGRLEFNPDISVELIDDSTLLPSTQTNEEEPILVKDENKIAVETTTPLSLTQTPLESTQEETPQQKQKQKPEICWYLASIGFLLGAVFLAVIIFFNQHQSKPISLTPLTHNDCELLSNEAMINSAVSDNYVRNFDAVRKKLNLQCVKGERFVFFYGDKLQTNGLGRVFLAHCAKNEDNPFSYCDNYFYYSWKY
ncbi:transcriptional regulator [Proteus terrae]|uniref:Winged helix family transcriptional regulator n=1 Tax=Proteus terrae subsp. cibarius TaxID=626774 RepID=A0ABX6JRW2_9GAMM|nr:winged helix family transcriptional regulator [Proteus terrae]MBG5949190.1 winged helix-turn-helix domain-containing protein [Proteus terrae]MCE9841521.1 winged helix-turn-helix domain-containing protein [Proteus terrae]QGW04658.1 winged helix family transcriptional regulator [Proteus terrae subsp. cibarius]QHD93791.1 winged helix family transcriptional regulator [Proteus terrae subsp. cibarius]QIF91935.1 winged helix family transcriptional regulator [Proteus terrae subsp. cibarius]